MKYKYCCVIDSNGYYKEFVVVCINEDGTETVYSYEMQEGESLIECSLAPVKKDHAESEGFIKPKWNGSEWVEGATDEETAEWNELHPAPESPTDDETYDREDIWAELDKAYEEGVNSI